MEAIHYLNVKEGDCSIIQHAEGHISVIDVCNASLDSERDKEILARKSADELFEKRLGVRGNFRQKEYPVNPISYMRERNITSVFRFILTHPEMDHMDGIADFFKAFPPTNFWDTGNDCEKDAFDEGSKYNEDDWNFYKSIRDGARPYGLKRLTLHSGSRGKFYNQSEDGTRGGDGLHILAPTPELVASANESGDYNDASYVIQYIMGGFTIVFGGDSHDATWKHILAEHSDLRDVDLLIAPHHGRDSGRNYEFLDVLNPKLTFIGNARSEHLAYDAWSSRGLQILTNNQAGCMIAETEDEEMKIYVTNRSYANTVNRNAQYNDAHKAYYIRSVFK